jgi:hypothetical protein
VIEDNVTLTQKQKWLLNIPPAIQDCSSQDGSLAQLSLGTSEHVAAVRVWLVGSTEACDEGGHRDLVRVS